MPYTEQNVAGILRDKIDGVADDGDLTSLDRFVELTTLKRQIDAAKRRLSEQLAVAQTELLEELVERGESKVGHAASGKTAYINRRIWARVARADKDATPEEHEASAAGLRAAGLAEFQGVKVNVQGLSAYFSELVKREAEKRRTAGDPRPVELDELLPEPLRGLIDLTEDTVLGLK